MEGEEDDMEFESHGSISQFTEEDTDPYAREKLHSDYGYMKITKELIKQTQQELGLVKLCWPEVDQSKNLHLKTLPSSYSTLCDKEKLLAWYAENFREQFVSRYPARKPLLLVCENECGVQKFVSTTIRRSTLPYPELYTWQGCGKFVSDYIEYEPLDRALALPKCLRSPTFVQRYRKCHSYECATFLTSLLLGQGYNAFVVSGYASREQTLCDLTRKPCPYLPKVEKSNQAIETPQPVIAKYKLKPPADYASLFLSSLNEEKEKKMQEKLIRDEQEEQKLIEELEQLCTDEYWGHRVHAWVAILPESEGPRKDEISFPIFLEPTTGISYCATDDDTAQIYLGVESIWNDKNYWVHMESTKSCASIVWDLTKAELWEHLLPGEPWTMRDANEEIEEEMAILQEKHLDMPFSYLNEININEIDYEQRYPNGRKTILYKKARVELYAPYLKPDGLIQKVIVYDDYDYAIPTEEYKNYACRSDRLIESRRNFNEDSVIDYYGRGRADLCKEHRYFAGNPSTIDSERIIDFYNVARLDGLSRIELHSNYITQHFVDRDDFLYYRVSIGSGTGTYDLLEINLRFRSPTLIADRSGDERIRASRNIEIREFCIDENEIRLMYHYNPGQFSRATRTYVKPPLAERGERLVITPAITHGYTPLGESVKRLELLYELDAQLKEEDVSISLIRQAEAEVLSFLENKNKEYSTSNLKISVYDKLRGPKLIGEDDRSQRESQGDVSDEFNFLKPYLARIGNPLTVSKDEARLIQQECLQDFKQLQVARANKILRSFEKCSQQLAKLQASLVQDEELTREEEEKLLQQINETNFTMQTLEARLSRHRNLVPKRYRMLLDILERHPIIASQASDPEQ